jgi:Predicted membrane protein (DUF2231)
MAIRNPISTAQIMGHPIHPMLIPFPIAFLVATLVCDLIFWRTGNLGWGHRGALSAWRRARDGGLGSRRRPHRLYWRCPNPRTHPGVASHDRQRCRRADRIMELVAAL